jgi:hypothetical protein
MFEEDTALAEVPAEAVKEPTLAADAVAWSVDDLELGGQDTNLRPRRRHWLVWAGLVALVCAVAATVVGLSTVLLQHPALHPMPAPTSAAAPTPDPPKTVDPAPVVHLRTLKDGDFLDKVHADHLPYPTFDSGAWAIVSARAVCEDLENDHASVDVEAGAIFREYTEPAWWTLAQTRQLILDAVTVYCPDRPH